MEIKVGDKVRVSKDAPRIFFGKCDMSQIELTVGVVDKDVAEIHIVNDEKTQMKAWIIPTKYLIKVDAEADANEKLQEEYARFMSGHTRISLADRIEREHIQTRMRVLSQEDFLKDFDPWEHKITPERPTYEVIVDNVTINWQRYEADLAKEVAVKLSKPNENKPDYVAEYAVSVAKAVVENLRKQ